MCAIKSGATFIYILSNLKIMCNRLCNKHRLNIRPPMPFFNVMVIEADVLRGRRSYGSAALVHMKLIAICCLLLAYLAVYCG